MNLSLYDEQLRRVAVIGGQFRSCLWSEGYNTLEPCLVELPGTEEYRRLVTPDRYIARDDRAVPMLIKSVEDRGQSLVVSGKQAARALEDLAFIGTLPAGFVIDTAIAGAYNKTRKIPGLTFNPDGLKTKCPHQLGSRSFLDLCLQAAQSVDLGFRVVRTSGGLTAEFYQPGTNPNLVFSEAFGNLSVGSVKKSTETYKNYAIVLGSGEGPDRIRVDVDQTAGQPRRDLIVDARDLRQEEGESLEAYKARLTARGQDKLLERVQTWACDFLPLAEDFGRRYDLGDVLTIRLPGYGVTLQARVTRYTQKEQHNRIKTTVTVGKVAVLTR